MNTGSDLQVTTEQLEGHQARLIVMVPEERVQAEMRRAARRVSSEVTIPGFRKGKAPYDVVLQRYGEPVIRKEAADRLASSVYVEALEREQIVPYDAATLEEMELMPLQFTFVVPLQPHVELGDYRSLRVEMPAVQVSPEDVARALEELRQQHAVLEPREGREAQPGDVLIAMVEGRDQDGDLLLSEEETEILLDPEEQRPVPGFHAALLGVGPGEERTFRLELPEDHPSEEVEFTVQVEQVCERLLPGLDDDLARTVGDFDTLQSLEDQLREQIGQAMREEAEEEYVEQVTEALVNQATLEYPPQMVEDDLDELVKRFGRQVQRERHLSFEDYLKVSGRTEEEVRADLRPRAETRVRRGLVMWELVEAEGLSVTEQEIDERVQAMGKAWGIRADEALKELQSKEAWQAVRRDLLLEKGLARLAAIARGEEESEE